MSEQRPILVYLDQADWAGLEARSHNGPAADAFRQLGAGGRALFVLSPFHLVETVGLREGLDQRLRFLRSLDGTYLMTPEAGGVEEMLARRLYGVLSGLDPPPVSLVAQQLATTQPEVLEEIVTPFRVVRRFVGWGAGAEQTARSARSKPGDDAARFASNFLSGDMSRLEAGMRRGGHGSLRIRIAKTVSRLVSPILSRLDPSMVELRDEPLLRSHVAAHFPKDVPNQVSALRELRVLRRDHDRWCRTAPELACSLAVRETLQNDLRRTYSSSDDLDASHALYAPIVDIFTCDKRNAEPIRRVLAKAGRTTEVVRSGRLEDVAAAVGRATDNLAE